jgi:uncharacterized repeat protein (TIGR01451 family)
MRQYSILLVLTLLLPGSLRAGVSYGDPSGGWAYLYTGDAAAGTPRRTPAFALDGTWRHENGSDEWNGDVRGAASPPAGGVESNGGILTIEDAVTTTSGNNNNRKIYFTHAVTQDGVSALNLLDTGVTLSFRARLTPTDAKSEIAMPNGYGIFSDGKGMFGVRQSSPSSIISFSLVRATEDSTPTASLNFTAAGLTMNRLNGDAPVGSGAVNNTATASQNQVLPLAPTVFHEFWITIQANDATPGNGTHRVTIYVDGSTTPTVFNVTAGTGSDTDTTITPNWTDYIALGLNNSATIGAFDTDFFAFKPGVIAPVPLFPPPPPTGVTVVNGDTKVTLTWGAVPGAAGYIIQRSDVSGGPYATVGTTGGTSFMDMGLVNGNTYYYVVVATNAAGSAASAEVVGQPNIPVTGVAAVGGTNQVVVSWNSLPEAVTYLVNRSTTSGGPYATIASGLTDTSYTDTTVGSGRTYYYVVFADLTGGGQSGISDEAPATTAPGAPALSAGLFAATVVRVAWTTTDPVVTQFLLEKSTDGVNFTPLATLPGSQHSYLDAGLALGSTHHYRIQAQNGTGFSDVSTVASITTPTFGVNVNFANTNFTTGQAGYPIPGYLDDYGFVYDDRGNGFYGWDDDNTQHGRLRNAANSPDKRYDTLNHMQKTTPLPAARQWEIEIPNGFYSVHIVAGDPTATDSVFQHVVEGVATPSVVPSAGNNWADYTVTVIVGDGRLSVTNGPAASNNKICFIDIYPAVAELVVIGTQPADTNVVQNRPSSLAVTLASGSTPVFYQWYQDGVPVDGATGASLVFPLTALSNAGNYQVVISNYAGSVTSDVAVLSVAPDLLPPQVVSVGSVDGIAIGVCFDELLDIALGTALDPFNYTVNGGNSSITGVVLRADGKSVALYVDPPISGAIVLEVRCVADLAGNAISCEPESPEIGLGQVLGLTAADLGTPLNPGANFTCDGQVIELVASGNDIWSAADQGYHAYRSVSGDFDAKVRVLSLTRADNISKAGLMMRESAAGNSRTIWILANPPPPGRNQIEPGMRATTGGNTATWGTTFTGANMPDTWMRLTRAGNVFTGYRSSNGVDWVQFAQTTQTYPGSVLLGLAATAHTNMVGLYATGTFRNFMITQTDFGDAPALYPTLLANSGARHLIVPGVHLGASVDGEQDGQPNATATGDDAAAVDDEDGVTFLTPLIPGLAATVDVVASVPGLLDAWIDFNGDGDWADAGEQIASSTLLAAGNNSLPVVVPSDAVPGATYARFRFSSVGGLSFDGTAVDGEVEDYQVTITPISDLGVVKSASAGYVAVGSNVTYTITVSNAGPHAVSGVTVTDTLPAEVSFVSASAGCANVGGTVTCAVGTLAGGGTATVTITVTATTTGTAVNSASVAGNGYDPEAANNSATAGVQIVTPPTLSNVSYSNGTFTLDIATQNGVPYTILYKNSLDDPEWLPLTTVTGDGTVMSIPLPGPGSMRFYLVRIP